jgi:hypothetical protein
MVGVIVSSTRYAMKKAAALSILVAVILLAGAILAEAQQPKKVFRIGYLSFGSSTGRNPQRIEGFRQGLRQLDTRKGKTLPLSIDTARKN